MILSFDSHTFDYHKYELHWHPKLAYQFFENNWYSLRVCRLSARRDEMKMELFTITKFMWK